jgi:EAL domain-containing protein (putative c-di-GMP-specific phosphodiesterase class I)
MSSVYFPSINIREIIERKAVETHFQAIASIRKKSIVGVEALSRGMDSNGDQIPPLTLFHLAAANGLTLELDRLCRATAVESFLPLHAANPDLILFVNCQTSTVARDAVDFNGLLNLVRRLNIDPRNVAIEILESEFEDATRLRESIARYKSCGFLVVLDDVGTGHSNLDRIVYVKPDILKADRSLVHDIHNNYYKQEVLKSLVKLSEKIGGWIIVEGVEKQEEAIVALDLGADMLQGFYFARPHKIERNDGIQYDLDRVHNTAARFKGYTLGKIKVVQSQHQKRLAIAKDIANKLEQIGAASFERKLTELIDPYPIIQSVCILDKSGTQISETILNPQEAQLQKTIIFRPPCKGTDHSLKEYYYVLMEAQIDPFETGPYVPLPSGDLCITASTSFKNANRETLILCLHINVDCA